MNRHNDMQARADSMRGFYERQRQDIVDLQKRRAAADKAYRDARDDMRWQMAHFQRNEARALHARITQKMRDLKSILHTVRLNQSAADTQNAARARRLPAAAE